MKKFFKKLAAFSAVTMIATGMCTMPVSAEELNQDFVSADEALYEVYPETFYTAAKIKDIQQKLRVKCEEEGLSQRETEEIVSLWDIENFTVSLASDETPKQAKQFFALCTAKANQSSVSSNSFNCDFKHNTNSVNYITVSSMRTLDNHTAAFAPYLNNTLYGETYKKMSWSFIDSFLGTTDGNPKNIAVYYINTNSNLSGVSGYNTIANNSEVNISNGVALQTFPIDGYNLEIEYDDEDTANKNIGALGDVYLELQGVGKIDSYDYNLVSEFAVKTRTPNKLQEVAADVNKDGKIDVKDATLINAYRNGTINVFS